METEQLVQTKLTLKERKAKDNELLKTLLFQYKESKKRINNLHKQKTESIHFEGSYENLKHIFESKKQHMKTIEKELKAETNAMWKIKCALNPLHEKIKINNRLDKMREEIKDMKKEECIAAKLNKQAVTKLDFNMFLKLPLEVVDIIQSFIPYEIRVSLLEERKPFKLFKNLTICTLGSFLMNITYKAEYFTLLTENEKQKQIYNQDDIRLWNPDWFQYKTRNCIETKIRYIFHKFKKNCPKGAYELMRMLLVLIKPDKKYNKYDGNWTKLTEIPV
jgi:hypothetical protein